LRRDSIDKIKVKWGETGELEIENKEGVKSGVRIERRRGVDKGICSCKSCLMDGKMDPATGVGIALEQ
jgi:hypothetical protein